MTGSPIRDRLHSQLNEDGWSCGVACHRDGYSLGGWLAMALGQLGDGTGVETVGFGLSFEYF